MSRRFPFKKEVTPLVIAVGTALTFGTVWLARSLVVDPPRMPFSRHAVQTKGERDDLAAGGAGASSASGLGGFDRNAASLSGQGQPVSSGKREVVARVQDDSPPARKYVTDTDPKVGQLGQGQGRRM